ncbi:hypothetical protein Taro_040369, partial [Colocasia esculenta]|nr:hypothetical protein [Colocasia esculenta]
MTRSRNSFQIPGEEWDKKEKQNRASDVVKTLQNRACYQNEERPLLLLVFGELKRVGGEDARGRCRHPSEEARLGGLEVEEEEEQDEDESTACGSRLSVMEGLAELSMYQSSSKMGFSQMSPPGSPLMAAAPSFPGAAHHVDSTTDIIKGKKVYM